jgi:hypothetical protein
MSIKHIVRAPQTDRYGLTVPTRPADLTGLSLVSATGTGTTFPATGPGGTFGPPQALPATGTLIDPSGIVQTTTPLTIAPKVAASFLITLTVIWDLAASFGDVSVQLRVLKNGTPVASFLEAARFGAGHTIQFSTLQSALVGEVFTFDIAIFVVGSIIIHASTFEIREVGPAI